MGDPDRLQQIAWNLLSNAVKFTPQGGSIEVRLQRKTNCVQLDVTDTGVGIASEFVPFAFDRFSQADSSITRSFGGLGLGLAIVRHLVELHGGTVKVVSAGENQGATFTVTLPFVVTDTNVARMESEGRAVVGGGNHPTGDAIYPMLDGLRLLVVDDDEDTREMVTMIFQRCGSEVRAASNASEALETFYGWQPEVMICDIEMPDEDGYSLISRVRAAESNGAVQTPAVALTGYARSEDRARALAAGYQLHIAKPIDPIELANAIIKLTKGGTLAGGTAPLTQDIAG
ncbi:MAG TPA: ATP-binding protein [Pyrinomonadaceae bacterium]|nr:ATP-binding protein [Pyrinomonadaceae bacterium]